MSCARHEANQRDLDAGRSRSLTLGFCLYLRGAEYKGGD